MMDEMTNEHWSTSEVAKALGVSPSLVRTWIAYMNWEVRRNAEGHRVFAAEDVDQLKALKAWLDEGHTLKEFRRERQGDGPYDPRLELRAGYRRLKELQSQEDALIEKHREILDSFLSQRQTLFDQLNTLKDGLETEDDAAPGAPSSAQPTAEAPSTSHIVQGVLKQLLTSLLEKQGKLQLLRRYEEDGKTRIEYMAPTGKHQVVEDLCTQEEDRRLLEMVLRLITQA